MQTLPSTDPQTAAGSTAVLDPKDCMKNVVPGYALLFFDHLHSEYLTLRPKISNDMRTLLDSLHQKRLNSQITWADIYTFDLALVDERPLENLIRKAFDARAKYRSIAGQKEYDEYVASKPPDLTAILIGPNKENQGSGEASGVISSPPNVITSPPDLITSPPIDPAVAPAPKSTQMSQSAEIVQRVLRADIRYLLNKFYLYYAMLPMRECVRDQLTTKALTVTLLILGVFGVLLLLSFGGGLLLKRWYDGITAALGLTVGSVVFFGTVGGCVSMLQRIQSAPTEGDALFNLAALNNGWRGLSLSPIYGAIFALLLFIMFASGIMQGTIFPKIETAAGSEILVDVKDTTAAVPAASPSESPKPDARASSTPTPTPTPTPSDTQRTGVLQLKDFLKQTGPQDGVSFALLMLWSFIAGFAERLVPDTLNRLVTKNEAIQGTNA
ncbi:MAG TPA: hypothetical protein VJP89_14855 [Pyrinomonadaceae bacterium]|nr:hypothetical protein [Pyrinomonadaceae bacterium]